MGKIRVKTIGDETAEKEQKKKAKKRKEAKKAEGPEPSRRIEEKVEGAVGAEDPGRSRGTKNEDAKTKDKTKETIEEVEGAGEPEQKDAKKTKKEKFSKQKAKPHSSKYQSVVSLVDKKKLYSLKDAVTLLPKLTVAKFDETVELHINTTEKGISGSFVLPHGTGRKLRVTVVNASQDPKGLEDVIKQIEDGLINFDVLIATPDSMPKLAKVARVLGPKGLMPNPKNGTVSQKPEEVAKNYAGGQVNYKTELKFPIMHLVVGKVSFGPEKLQENIAVALNALPKEQIVNVTLKSTMSPGIKVQI